MTVPQGTAAMLVAILERAPSARPDELLDLARSAARALGVGVPNLLLVDMEQRFLKPFPGSATEEPQGVDATVAGRAYRSMQPVEVAGNPTPRRLFLPLLDGSERLYGDAVARTRRGRDMVLAAEIQWDMLPPLTLSTATVSVSGILEPCYEIGGDAFDYAFNTPLLHILLCDAIGHGLDSSMMSSVLLGAYRNCRRAGWGLPETHQRLDTLVAERFGPERFATAQLGELDCRDGILRWINSGHPAPMLVRRTQVVGRLEQPPYLPIGFGDGEPAVAEAQLEPGDSLLWFTDGVVEARSPEGGFFGEERLADLLERATASGAPVPEIVRRLTHALLSHQAGNLRDDATMLLVTWHVPLPPGAGAAGTQGPTARV